VQYFREPASAAGRPVGTDTLCAKAQSDGHAAPIGRGSGTAARLGRAARPFAPLAAAGRRRFHAVGPGRPTVVAADHWREGSLGDPFHKLLLVRAGRLDVEGAAGGWLVLRGHMLFLPAGRQFNLRIDAPTVAEVVHLDPADAPWRHEGCWVNAAPKLAQEMMAYLLRPGAGEEAVRQACRTVSFLCSEWFGNPRMLFVPALHSPELRAMADYVLDALATATVAGAVAASGLAPRTLHARCLRETGFGPRSFIREIRLMRAMELLALEGLAVQAAAEAVGFASLPSFTAAFSSRLGVAPSEFARRTRDAGGA
jgi:AraC-like DNA-binding protein